MKNEWISVKDGLPNHNQEVLICQKYGNKDYQAVFTGYYAERFKNESRSETEWDGIDDYCEEKDCFFEPQGWYENQYNWDEFAGIYCEQKKVTHWMPLPDKPRR